MKILIAGYPYIKENYFRTFDFYPEKKKVFFLLPKTWKAKGGKIIFKPPLAGNVFTASAFFYHSRYPVIGGLLKGWMPAFPLTVSKLKKSAGLQLIYSPSEPILLTTLYQGIWARIFGLKHVIFSWENVDYRQKFHGFNGLIKKIILKLNLVFCDGIICGNKKGEAIFRRLTDRPTVAIPLSGVDEKKFSPPPSTAKKFRDFNWEGKMVYAFCGAIGYRKGIHLLLKAFQETRLKIPNGHLVIVGSGEYEEEIDRMIIDLGLSSAVTRIPWLHGDDLRDLLAVADVFLYPSISYQGWEEQFGYSMAEASLMELPVIATHSGSIEEVIIDGYTGLLVEPNNVSALTEAMIKLGWDSDLRRKLGQAGRRYTSGRFSYQVVAEKFYRFFKEVSV